MNYYKLSLVNKTLTVSKAFEEAVATGEGEEYELYTKWKREIPDLKVIRKTHKTPTKYKTKSGEVFRCNQFKNLTYKNMETFIMSLPEAEMFMNEYVFVKEYAGAVQTNAYALTRKWFVSSRNRSFLGGPSSKEVRIPKKPSLLRCRPFAARSSSQDSIPGMS